MGPNARLTPWEVSRQCCTEHCWLLVHGQLAYVAVSCLDLHRQATDAGRMALRADAVAAASARLREPHAAS
jgi:hypothetical protein